MSLRERWLLAVVARAVEQWLFCGSSECKFNLTKSQHILLIPGLGASVWQLFGLVNALRQDVGFQDFGVTVVPVGLSLGDFALTLQRLIDHIERELLGQKKVTELVLFGHSHGGRFACELAVYLHKKYPKLHLTVITAGTPILHRPLSAWGWPFSVCFRQWPTVQQPVLSSFYALYSPADLLVRPYHATTGAKAKLVKVDGFSHRDFRKPKVVEELKKILLVAEK